MTYAGFCKSSQISRVCSEPLTYPASAVVHLSAIPPVLRWLQYFSVLKYCLEALAVNEITSGLKIQDTLEGVPVDVSATVIMQLVSSEA